MSRPPYRPTFPRHSQRNRDRILGTCSIYVQTIRSCPCIQRLYESTTPYQLDTERSTGRCQELTRVCRFLEDILARMLIAARRNVI